MHSVSLLYIEDDEDIRTIYSSCLESLIETLYYAGDGEEGFELYLKYKPNIILLDINMPKRDGLSLAQQIRQLDKSVKIIITSAHGDQSRLLQAIELGLVKYLLKPIEPQALQSAVGKAVEEIQSEKGEATNHHFVLDPNTIWNRKEEKLLTQNIEIKLTKNERRLLAFLSTDKHRVFTFFEIFNHLSEDNFDKEYDANQIRALVKLIRKKIPKDAILNVYGEGYRFNPLN